MLPSADGSRLLVTCRFDDSLVAIDAETLAIEGEVAVGDGPRAFGALIRRP